MHWPLIVILGLVVAAGFIVAWGQHRHVAPLLRRPSALPSWRQFVPLAPDDAVQKFLLLVVNAFALPSKCCEVLRPDDRVLDLYRAVTPPNWTAGDQGELEAFVLLVKHEYGVDLAAAWREDLTLGEVFTLARS